MAFTTPRDWTAGEFVTEAMMDAHIRDNFLSMGPHLIVRKTADEAISNTTLQNDDALTMSVGAAEVWQFEFDVLATGVAGNIKFAGAFSGAGTMTTTIAGLNVSATVAVLQNGTTTSPMTWNSWICQSDTIPTLHVIKGVFTATGAQTVTLQWAQNVASGTTTVRANSTLWAVKLA